MKKTGPGLILLIILFLQIRTASATDQVDIGIFESTIDRDTLIIKARPNYNLASPWYITNIAFTIRWPQTSNVTQLINITSSVNSFFGLQVQQSTTYGGYRYQVYAVVGQKFVNWTAGQEYPILEVRVNYTGGDCTTFEISDDAYTWSPLNGRFYFEVAGGNRTGIIYQPSVSLISMGGSVTGDETICLGTSTSMMTLSGYSGVILGWQKKHDAFGWWDIPGTAGQTMYYSTPDSAGTYLYRAMVRRSNCEIASSSPASIMVDGYSRWTGAYSSNWSSSANWNVCGVPPTDGDVIIQQTATNIYPVLQGTIICNTMEIENGARIILGYGATLTVGQQSR